MAIEGEPVSVAASALDLKYATVCAGVNHVAELLRAKVAAAKRVGARRFRSSRGRVADRADLLPDRRARADPARRGRRLCPPEWSTISRTAPGAGTSGSGQTAA